MRTRSEYREMMATVEQTRAAAKLLHEHATIMLGRATKNDDGKSKQRWSALLDSLERNWPVLTKDQSQEPQQ